MPPAPGPRETAPETPVGPAAPVAPVAPVGPVGRVVLIRRFPLKSAAGDLPEVVVVDPGGLRADRARAVATADGAVLRPRDHPWLAGLRARPVPQGGGGTGGGSADDGTGGGTGGHLLVLGPAGPLGSTADPQTLDAALSALAGAPVRVVASQASATGAAAVHLVSTAAADDPDAPPGADPGERANLVIALDPSLPPGAERGWEGRRVRVGGAELALVRRPRHCLGIYADVLRPGPVRLGDRVDLLGPSGGPPEPG